LVGAVPMGDPTTGEVPWMMTAGPDPFNITQQSFFSLLDPALKVVTEEAMGRNSFTGREFSDPDVIAGFGGRRFRVVKDAEGNIIEMQPVEKTSRGFLEATLQQIPQYNLLRTAVAGGKPYDTLSLPQLGVNRVTGGPTAMLDYSGQPVAPQSALSQFVKYGGVNVIPYDITSYQEQLQREAERAAAAYQRQQLGALGG
jgi:hypothetical protein